MHGRRVSAALEVRQSRRVATRPDAFASGSDQQGRSLCTIHLQGVGEEARLRFSFAFRYQLYLIVLPRSVVRRLLRRVGPRLWYAGVVVNYQALAEQCFEVVVRFGFVIQAADEFHGITMVR
eukprot:TRINITY_DN8861_c0_g1_i2.p2 TRINITY_DN8861_c0_g1~~TRINITY_DN8861_c0_g1_i2.p2  ORF type:complete len:122 (-),score=2.91 TRINITY_DN8861_c0_g1_i2:232-597(-)